MKYQHWILVYKLFHKMLKVKKKIQPKTQKNDELIKLQKEIKNSIKNLYIKDQKNEKTINEYARIITKIRNEYAQIQKENNQLRIEIQKYQNYIQYNQNVSEKYRKPYFQEWKRMQYYDESAESDESESYTEIRRRPKQPKKRRILYEDEIDEIPYEPDSPTEDGEQEEDDIYESKKQKQIEKPKRKKQGITKSIKM